MPSLNLVLYNLSGNMKLSLEKKIIGGLGIAIVLVAGGLFISLRGASDFTTETQYLLYTLSGVALVILISIFFTLKRDIIGYSSIGQQLRSSKEQLQQYMDSANELVQSVARDGSFITVNKSWLKTLGYSDEDVKDLKIFEIIAPESQEAFADIFQKLSRGEEFQNLEVTYIAKDGKRVILEGNSVNLTQKGKVAHTRTFFRDITDRRHAELELKKLNEDLERRVKEKTVQLEQTNMQLQVEVAEHKQIEKQLRHLSARLQSVREEERTRIAREIHDELGQQLTGIKMDLSWIYKKIEVEQPKEIGDKVTALLKLIDDTIKTVRKISTELRPGILDDLGLIAAIEWQCSEFEKRNGIKCTFTTGLDDLDFGTNISTEVFRIVQETLTNIVRHSNATSVDIKMKLNEGTIMMEISDNGKGITVDEINNTKSLGLLGMGERAKILGGKFSIKGKPGKGTAVTLQVPFSQKRSSLLDLN